MRAIKFRAWYQHYPVGMVYDVSPHTNPKTGRQHMITSHNTSYGTGNKVQTYEELTKAFFLMQYTGLKDKKGVEIYEGDIVKTESESMQIVYCHSGFHLAWSDGGISAPLHPFLITNVGVEVIGNIYENNGMNF